MRTKIQTDIPTISEDGQRVQKITVWTTDAFLVENIKNSVAYAQSKEAERYKHRCENCVRAKKLDKPVKSGGLILNIYCERDGNPTPPWHTCNECWTEQDTRDLIQEDKEFWARRSVGDFEEPDEDAEIIKAEYSYEEGLGK